jgi:hypothetical protein
MALSTDVGMAFVDAPTGLTGFLLAMRSPGSGSQNVEDIRGHWIVRVPVSDADAVRALLERVQVWLRQERIGETRVSVGEDVYRVGVDYADLQQASGGK